MENQKNPDIQPENQWMDQLLPPPELGQEIGPDEQAVESAGLIRPEDAELEKIIAEAKSMERASIPDDPFWNDDFQEGNYSSEPIPPETPELSIAGMEMDADLTEQIPEDSVDYIPEPSEQLILQEPEASQLPSPEISRDAEPPLTLEKAEESAVAPDIDTLIPEAALLRELFSDDVPEEPLTDTSAEDDDLFPTWDSELEAQILADTPVPPVSVDSILEEFPAEDPAREEELHEEIPILLNENLDDAYSDEDPDAQEAPEEPAAPRKIRPRMKKGYGLFGIPHILSTVIWLAITVAIGVSLGRTLWVCAADVLAFGREEAVYSITITDSDNIDTIAAKLEKVGLIKYPGLFKLYAGVAVDDGDISPGTYKLSTLYDYHALVKSMNQYSSVRETVEVVIPEGYTCAQIFTLLEKNAVCTVEELEEYAMNGELKDYWFLEGVSRTTPHCLEGFLFPDTYQFYIDDSPGRVLGKLLGDQVGGFEVRFTDLMQEKLVSLNERLSAMMKKNGYDQEYIDAHQMDIYDVVIVASMIEKESTGADAYDIASVIYNRLTNAKDYPYLNIDATIIYALDGNIDPETGKAKPLTAEDLQLDDPYNTYVYKGMIPGPIANPGTNSLLAALDPNDTNYHYYVYDYKTGVHLFAKNAKEHEKNVAKARSDS